MGVEVGGGGEGGEEGGGMASKKKDVAAKISRFNVTGSKKKSM